MIKSIKSVVFIALFFTILISSFGQEKSFDEIKGADVRVYKSVSGFDLKLNIIYPADYQKGKTYPAIIFFFGGGWKNGDVHQFEHQCGYMASKGIIAISANYRVESRNNSTAFDAVEDAKSAIRWIREHAKDLGINKNRIVAAGGSAGGHLAACTAILSKYDASDENLSISSRPNALILFNPVINTMPEGYGFERLGEKAESISPAHHVVFKIPPTLIFHGTEDKTVHFENITDFQSKMKAAGNICYVIPFERQEHGFFNYGRNNNKFYDLTMEKSESFLRELKYIK